MYLQPDQLINKLATKETKNTPSTTYLHDLHDSAHDSGGSTLGVVTAHDDAVEELAPLAHLHDQVHGVAVLERLTEPHDVYMRGQRPHDGYLAPHVLDVDAAPELPLADRLARELLSPCRVHAPSRHPKLAAPQLLAKLVPPEELLGVVGRGQALAKHGYRRLGRGTRGVSD